MSGRQNHYEAPLELTGGRKMPRETEHHCYATAVLDGGLEGRIVVTTQYDVLVLLSRDLPDNVVGDSRLTYASENDLPLARARLCYLP